ncbi:transposase [Acinetobacter larvae]|uniref:Transposase n=1 Tax=Acinetobacter larvae TaxID=1789224 RepID=A0A1B2LXL8_9GAMM|nr:transposase [Acinetobacter larvae]AOA57698.1 hypothetical protein BFG52_04540 [Acinetobacter larvae]
MTSETLNSASTKFRKARKIYSPAERAEILKLCKQPNASINEIAKLHDIHENTLYKWRHKAKQQELISEQVNPQAEFISIPLNMAPDQKQRLNKVIRIELPNPENHSYPVILEWPIESATELSLFITRLMS